MDRKAAKKVNISFVFLFALTTSSLVYDCQSESIEDHRLLHRSLLDENYDPLLRPANDTSYPVNVGFRFTPIIALLNEVSQELTLRGMLVLTWEDFRLRWDPWEHNYINETDIPMLRSEDLQIWIPELVLNESLQTDYATFQPESYIARLYSTGQVYWLTLAGTKTFCGINVRYFPFDKQRCFLTFSTWAYHSGEFMKTGSAGKYFNRLEFLQC